MAGDSFNGHALGNVFIGLIATAPFVSDNVAHASVADPHGASFAMDENEEGEEEDDQFYEPDKVLP